MMLVKGVDDVAHHNDVLKVGKTWLSHAPLPLAPPPLPPTYVSHHCHSVKGVDDLALDPS